MIRDNEYKTGYDKGWNDGWKSRDKEIVCCKDCKHWSKDEKEEVDGKEIRPCENGLYPEWHSGEWFCKGGERK